MRTLFPALAALLLATSAQSTTLITDVDGIHADDKGEIAHFDGILIGDDGKVKALLKKGDPRPAADKVVGFAGLTVMPGLIDAHGHIAALGQALLSLDLTGTSSLDDLKARLKAYAAANPGAKWIVGRGWNQELWAVKAFPTAADLDAVVADRPVVLGRVDGHALVANTKAMELANYGPAVAVPSGGRVDKGLFVDAAQPLIEKAIPEPTEAERDAALTRAQEALLEVGVVAAADMGTDVADWETMRRAGEANKLKVRIMSYAGGLTNWRVMNEGAPTGWEFGDHLVLLGAKLYADGALGSRGAYLKAPYADKPDTRGLSLISGEELLKAADEVSNGRGQLAIHAIGDAANAEVIDVLEKTGAKWGRFHRPRIEHFQIVDPKDIPRLKPAGIIASMQPVHQTSDRTMAEARLGPGRLGGAYAWHTVLKLGIPLAFGSDFPVESPNPFPGLAAAISRQDMNGQPPGGWRPAEKISLGQALHAFTRGAAYAGFAEGKLGCLDEGCQADLVFVDRPVSANDAQALARTKVLETWVGGIPVFKALGPPPPALAR